MVGTSVVDAQSRNPAARHVAESSGLAARLPRLALEARRVSAAASAGAHGRRKTGPGEAFWQYRPFVPGEPAARVDWRRSAREDVLFVREREHEAAHTVWIWPDLSSRMGFKSTLSQAPKSDRALVIALALAEMLTRGGDRAGLLGLTKASSSRKIATAFCQALADARAAFPSPVRGLADRDDIVLIGDFLDPLPVFAERLDVLSGRGRRGHAVVVLDPAEETFPFDGQAVFVDEDGSEILDAGDAAAFRPSYMSRLTEHLAGIRALCAKRGWSMAVHRTDRPATEVLLALSARIASGGRR